MPRYRVYLQEPPTSTGRFYKTPDGQLQEHKANLLYVGEIGGSYTPDQALAAAKKLFGHNRVMVERMDA